VAYSTLADSVARLEQVREQLIEVPAESASVDTPLRVAEANLVHFGEGDETIQSRSVACIV
jgi:hypothetical protein